MKFFDKDHEIFRIIRNGISISRAISTTNIWYSQKYNHAYIFIYTYNRIFVFVNIKGDFSVQKKFLEKNRRSYHKDILFLYRVKDSCSEINDNHSQSIDRFKCLIVRE